MRKQKTKKKTIVAIANLAPDDRDGKRRTTDCYAGDFALRKSTVDVYHCIDHTVDMYTGILLYDACCNSIRMFDVEAYRNLS